MSTNPTDPTDLPLSEEAVEAAVNGYVAFLAAIPKPEALEPPTATRMRGATRAAIHGFLRAEGFEIQKGKGELAWNGQSERLVGPWHPSKEPSAEAER